MKRAIPNIAILTTVGFASLLLSASSVGGSTADRSLEDSSTSSAQDELGGRARGVVYALTNDPNGNRVSIFLRDGNGQLRPAGSVATGGRGVDSGLGSQGSLVLSPNGRQLFAVNAGSNQVSSFVIRRNAPALVDVVPSGGEKPISLTLNADRLFVLNAGGVPNITGLTVDADGRLLPMDDGTRTLSSESDVQPAQVQFKPDGSALVVTEKATNNLLTYTFDSEGVISQPLITLSFGMTPFGFAFSQLNGLIVSEAFGGAKGASAVSSYSLSSDNMPMVLSGSVPDGQSAACWTAVTGNGRFAYVTNTGSGTLSGYSVDLCGGLTLLDNGISADTGADSGPTEMALSRDSRYLYVLTPPAGKIFGYAIDSHSGSLTPVVEVNQVALTATGLAAR
jgi:6-phosphogluconolactonase (cycloisomerase 2 family)